MSPVLSCRRIAIAVVAMFAAAASTAGPALASGSPGDCPEAPISHPFAPWGDQADYELAPGGDIEEAGATWSLSGGAAAQEGNETFMVGAPTDHRSLRLPAYSSATTDRKCIGAKHTSFRLFVKRSGSALSALYVDVVFTDSRGRDRAVPAGVVFGSSSWAPSQPLPLFLSQVTEWTGGTIDVSFRFRAVGDAAWSIDDVYVDPWRSH